MLTLSVGDVGTLGEAALPVAILVFLCPLPVSVVRQFDEGMLCTSKHGEAMSAYLPEERAPVFSSALSASHQIFPVRVD